MTGRQRLTQFLIPRLVPKVAALIGRLCAPRPLTPFPGWVFDKDLNSPAQPFRFRRALWRCLQTLDAPVELAVRWHRGTRLCLDMQNDTARQIFVCTTIDPNEFSFLNRIVRKGMVVADVGANEGVYTVFLAKVAGTRGKVFAFEPSTREMARLAANVRLNRLANVEMFPIALADCAGIASLDVAEPQYSGHNSLGGFIYDVARAAVEQVPTALLDTVAAQHGWPRLDAVKIDTEGAELRVLKGASETLRKHCPLLLFELSHDALARQGGSAQQVLAFLSDLGYSVYEFSPDTGLPAPVRDSSAPRSHNVIAIPDRASRQGRTLNYNLDWAQ